MKEEKNLKNIKKQFKDNGVYYTPQPIIDIMMGFVDNKPNTVYDPTCGQGNLLKGFSDDVEKYGQELDNEELDKCKETLNNFKGYCGDTLKDDGFKGINFDCIIANPPYSVKWEQDKTDERFSQCPFLAPKSKADYAFILHILHHLKDDGVAVVLGATGILFRGNSEGKIRKWLIEQNYIDRLVYIPGKQFTDTTIPTVIMVLKKNRTTTDIIIENREIEDEEENKRTVTMEEIEKNDYNLNIQRYLYKEEPKEKIDLWATVRELFDTDIKLLRNELEFFKIMREDLHYGGDEFPKGPITEEMIPVDYFRGEIQRVLDDYFLDGELRQKFNKIDKEAEERKAKEQQEAKKDNE